MTGLRPVLILLLLNVLAACTGSAGVELVDEKTPEAGATSEPTTEPTVARVVVEEPASHQQAPDAEAVADACTDVEASSIYVDHDGQPYCLGAPVLTADDVESARRLDDIGTGSFEIVLTSEGQAKFNAVAPDCFNRTAACLTGQIAIVVDGYVESAPSIQSPKFDQPSLVVSGNSLLDESDWITHQIQLGVPADFLEFRVVLHDPLSN